MFHEVRADIMLVRKPKLMLRVEVENLKSFPQYTLVGVSFNVNPAASKSVFSFVPDKKVNIFENNVFTIYAVPRGYLDNLNAKTVDWQNDKRVIKTNMSINAASYKLKDPVESMELGYKIVGLKDGVLILYKSMQAVNYSNDKLDVVRHWEYKAGK